MYPVLKCKVMYSMQSLVNICIVKQENRRKKEKQKFHFSTVLLHKLWDMRVSGIDDKSKNDCLA